MNVISLYPKNSIFYQKLFSLVLPIAFQQFMLAAVSASDALMLGFVSQNALSAVSLAGQITFVFNLFRGGLTMGTRMVAAQYYGKGDFISIEKILLILPAKFQVSDKQIWQQKIPDRKLLRLRLYIRSHNLVPELHRLQ